jgi:hypothetical protein
MGCCCVFGFWPNLMVFSPLVPNLDFLSLSPHVHLLAIFDHHTHLFGCKRCKSDGFTIFYNDIPILNIIMNCLPIILLWPSKQDVTC